MSPYLSPRQTKALRALEIETSLLEGDYSVKGALSPGIGERTLSSLVDLGLAEMGRSDRYHGEVGYRISLDGERCLTGGLTMDEVGNLPAGQIVDEPKQLRWPLT